ncbi:MAG: glycosyltransferase [Chloroflexi bacterium]|nr:glycosyltransferase [Chloroflexota bacterium]
MSHLVPCKVSLVAVFHNEENSLPSLLDSVLAQTRMPDEILFVDDRSTDGTRRALNRFKRMSPVPVTVLILDDTTAPGGNLISKGRNLAMACSKGELIACTDGGCVLDRNWLANIVARLEGDPSIDVAAGYYGPDRKSLFDEALAAATFKTPEELRGHTLPSSSIPSARSLALRKAAWKEVGGFPEDLHFSEDSAFFSRLARSGRRLVYAEDAVVYKRLSHSLGALFWKYLRYGRGEGLVLRAAQVYGVRSAAYLAGVAVAAASSAFPVGWLALTIAAAAYLVRPYKRIPVFVGLDRGPARPLAAAVLIPIFLATCDIAKIIGFSLGLIERVIGRQVFGHLVRYGV